MIKTGHQNIEQALYHHFGFSSFREGQKDIIESVLSKQHTLATLPTGSGKSICYQLPAMLSQGTTLVVSPLISLMIDQVKLLKSQGFKRVTSINSMLDQQQKLKVLNHLHHYQLIYCSPEMLQQPLVMNKLRQLNISLLVIDEAHCISQWGHEFRPDYLRLNHVIRELKEPTVLALSATATPKIQNEIIHYLDLKMNKIIYPMDRTNISYAVIKSNHATEKQEQLLDVVEKVNAPTMIYFSSRQVTEQICSQLQRHFPNRTIAFYHGGMEQQDRLLIQQQFMLGQLDIICCTSAFGMGINKDNVRLIIHFHMPSNIESFIQETGRAGRDGEHSVSVLLYSKGDEALPFQLIETELPDDQEITLYVNHGTNDSLTEVKERFLKSQTDQLGRETNEDMIKNIINSRNERKEVKLKSVLELLKWVHSERCRRQSLFESYQPFVRSSEYECCDNCGFDLSSWRIDQTDSVTQLTNWRTILDKLLPDKRVT